jgi:hypothetical protein
VETDLHLPSFRQIDHSLVPNRLHGTRPATGALTLF